MTDKKPNRLLASNRALTLCCVVYFLGGYTLIKEFWPDSDMAFYILVGVGTAVGVPILRWRRRNRGSERHNGTVKWFNERKGYGFIAQENGDDVFVHYREIRGEGFKTLTEGQQVEFGLVTRDKGTAAEDVVPTD